MREYFKESIEKNVPLRITTNKNKTFVVFVKKYSEDKLYYTMKNSSSLSQIFFRNIVNVEFEVSEDESKSQKLELPSNIRQFLSYYETCVKELEKETNFTIRGEMFETMLESIFSQSADNLLVRYLKNQKQIKNTSALNKIVLLNKSNISQRTAIKNALNNDISIIQGPPGTGKTTTILSLLANLIMDGKNVVVVSKNNSAVDNIIEEFEKTSLPDFYLRFGKKEKYMDPLEDQLPDIIANLKKSLNGIPESDNSLLNNLQVLQNRLEIVETEIDELITIKNLIVDLKTQKKFMDKEQEIYNFKELLTLDEMKIVCEKNASPKKLVKIFEYSRKHKFNFFQRLFIRYYFCIKDGDINQKFYAISQLLKEVYIKKEIAQKEFLLLESKLKEKQDEVKKLYDQYVDVCMEAFKKYLKKRMSSGLSEINDYTLQNVPFHVYPLILTTADAFLYNFKGVINSNQKIDAIIIDEASQCDVLTGLPLLYAAKKLVVVGDEKQLSAITNLEIDTDIPNEFRYNDNTFLNCIKNVMDPIEQTLVEHYRCDQTIISFCNKFYYENKLKIYTDASPSAIEILDANKCKGVESKNHSFCNKRECFTIEGLVDKNTDYFVITPFKEQGKELKKRFSETRAGTIHTFQGKGAENVYFSAVLNDLSICDNHIKGDHNLFTRELINVAVSRAKKMFVLITDKNYFQKNIFYVPEVNHLIDYIKIYGEQIDDDTSCWYDYLYRNIPYYKKTPLYDNEYEEVTHYRINSILENTSFICRAKVYLSELILNRNFLNSNPKIKEYIRNGAHSDFSIFDTRTGKLKVAIELDGKDHNKKEQKIKDAYKDKAFHSISVPIIRMKSKDDIDDGKFIKELKKYIELK